MGIDVYLEWDAMTEAEKKARYTGFATAGRAGYLREAYHGGPYGTKALIPEGWEPDDDGSAMDAMVAGLAGKIAEAMGPGTTVHTGAAPQPDPELRAPPTRQVHDPTVRINAQERTYDAGNGKTERYTHRSYSPPGWLLALRLPRVMDTVRERSMKVYQASVKEAQAEAMQYAAFVERYRMLEIAGRNPRIEVSA